MATELYTHPSDAPFEEALQASLEAIDPIAEIDTTRVLQSMRNRIEHICIAAYDTYLRNGRTIHSVIEFIDYQTFAKSERPQIEYLKKRALAVGIEAAMQERIEVFGGDPEIVPAMMRRLEQESRQTSL